jgi:uncharacterized protein (TIGR04255 family)
MSSGAPRLWPMTSRESLPRFDDPPVNEVVITLQFEPLAQMTPVHLGAWWQGERRNRYPMCEVRPPLPPELEDFSAPEGPSFRVGFGQPAPAIWFRSKDRTEVIQVQQDRFSRNWSRPDRTEPYIGFERIVADFEEELASFRAFITDEGLGDLVPTQCEVRYINPIELDEAWGRHGQLDRVIAPWSGNFSEGFLPEPEDLQFGSRFLIRGEDDAPIGRLIVTLQSVRTAAEDKPVFLLQLQARGQPTGGGIVGELGFLELGHEWIVRGFATLTTPEMHEHWRRKL